MVKGVMTISVDIELIQLAKERYKNVSGRLGELLRADLGEVEEQKESNEEKRILQLKNQLSVNNAKLNRINKELAGIKQKKDDVESEKKRKEKEYFEKGEWL